MENLTAEAIDKIASLATGSLVNRLKELPNGSIILQDVDSFTEVYEPTKDASGLTLVPPKRISWSTILQDADSLVEYIKRFKSDGTAIFANIQQNRITAIIDFHKDSSTTDHGEHKAILSLPFSEEYNIWKKADGDMKSQLDFARFIEENGGDIAAPAGADLLEVCRDLQAVRKVDFTKAVRTNTDTESFEYKDETNLKAGGAGAVEVPTKFQLEMPIYFNGKTYKLFAFLRWNLVGPSLTLGIALHRLENVRQAVFKEVVSDIAERAGVPAFYANL